jgi:hypothetical protein
MGKPKLPVVLVFHDGTDWPSAYVDMLNHMGFSARLYRTPSECMERIRIGLGRVDVVMIHKDLGVHVPDEWDTGITSDSVVRSIHDEAPFVRIGIVSGEYPDGMKHVLEVGADFYLGPHDLYADRTIEILRKGPVTPQEIAGRGIEVEMPGRPSGRERVF